MSLCDLPDCFDEAYTQLEGKKMLAEFETTEEIIKFNICDKHLLELNITEYSNGDDKNA